MLVLGIETSCDETAAAVVTDSKEILSNIVFSQIKEHSAYGGVVPEIAARSHMNHIGDVIKRALKEAKVEFADLDGIAATTGPGLIGGLIVGLMTAKGIASASKKPFISVNHLEGHALTARLSHDVTFPFLLLLISGGHCQILAVEGVGNYKLLGTTLDDALGEAFDKTAKMLGLGYPGGPKIEQLAKNGDSKKFDFPRPMLGRPGCNFSFSGLKTAIRLTIQSMNKELNEKEVADVCASFQECAGDILEDRIGNAIKSFKKQYPESNTFVVAGGVAANKYLNSRMQEVTKKHGFNLIAPPPKLCTDNAAMIAWAGIEKLKLGQTDNLEVEPRARWPLDESYELKEEAI